MINVKNGTPVTFNCDGTSCVPTIDISTDFRDAVAMVGAFTSQASADANRAESSKNVAEQLKDRVEYLVDGHYPYITPDMFEGSDADKLMSAIASIGVTGTGTIVLNRKYVLDRDVLLDHRKNERFNNIYIVGTNKNAGLDMQTYKFYGKAYDTGHDTWDGGAICFENMMIEGTETFADCAYLTTLSFKNVTFRGFKVVSTDVTNYISGLGFENCIFYNITDACVKLLHQGYYINFSMCKFERCNKALECASNLDWLIQCCFNQCCIQFSTAIPIKFTKGHSLVVSNCYFEGNPNDIDISECTSIEVGAISIVNNTSVTNNSDRYFVKLPPYSSHYIGEIKNNTIRGSGNLLHFEISSNDTLKMTIDGNWWAHDKYYGAIRNAIVQSAYSLNSNNYIKVPEASYSFRIGQTNTFLNSGATFVVPAKSRARVTLRMFYDQAKPTGIAISSTINDYDIVKSNDGGRFNEYLENSTNTDLTYRIFVRSTETGTNSITVNVSYMPFLDC